MEKTMARCLFTVEYTFLIEGRGLVPFPGIVPQGDEKFRVGDPIRLKRPDGSEIEWKIGGLELSSPLPPNKDVCVLLNGLGKGDVPIGTEVWSVDARQNMDRHHLEQSWAITRDHLEAARHLLPEMLRDSDEGYSLQRYNEWLAHNELELAIDELEGLGDENVATTAFWAELLTAAENMGLAKHVERYKKILAK